MRICLLLKIAYTSEKWVTIGNKGTQTILFSALKLPIFYFSFMSFWSIFQRHLFDILLIDAISHFTAFEPTNSSVSCLKSKQRSFFPSLVFTSTVLLLFFLLSLFSGGNVTAMSKIYLENDSGMKDNFMEFDNSCLELHGQLFRYWRSDAICSPHAFIKERLNEVFDILFLTHYSWTRPKNDPLDLKPWL